MDQKKLDLLASAIRSEISRKGSREEFSWSHTIRLPITREEAEYICYKADCRCAVRPEGIFRFYADHTLPAWQTESADAAPEEAPKRAVRKRRPRRQRETIRVRFF